MKLDPYAAGALDKDVHVRLVADLDNVCDDAGIKPFWVCTPLGKTGVTDQEVLWVRRWRYHTQQPDVGGLCLIGRETDPIMEDRMAAIAGALTRNFIRARVMTVHQVLEFAEAGEVPDMSCLLVPNFFVEKSAGGALAQWKVGALHDLMMTRHSKGLLNVLGVTNMTALSVEYGSAFQAHLASHYEMIEIG